MLDTHPADGSKRPTPGTHSGGPDPVVGPRDPRPVMVVVHARARVGMEHVAKRELMAIAEPIRANPDCLDYRVYQDRRDGQSFVFYERWVNEPAFEAHLERDYMDAYKSRVDDLFEGRRWDYMQEVHRHDVIGGDAR
jgi:quinol monooxygenase YgiN